MADYVPKFKPGQAPTLTVTAAVTGGQLVTTAGAVAAADSTTWLGVASRDALVGEQIGVYCDGIQRLTAAGALPAGSLVKCAAAGQVTTWVPGTDGYERFVGVLLEASTAAGQAVAATVTR